jgi:elongation factor P
LGLDEFAKNAYIYYNIAAMSIGYTDLKKGMVVVIEGSPCEIMEVAFLRMQQRKATVQTKFRNLITGKVLDRNWQASDSFEEADIEKKKAMFIYVNRGEYWFHEEGNPKARFSLSEDTIGPASKFLKNNTLVDTVVFEGNVISVRVPIKMEFVVKEAPPGVRGNTAQGGTKQVVLENGATLNTPLFIEEGELIRVNTETGEYVERVNK